MDLSSKTAGEIVQAVKSGELGASEYVEFSLSQIESGRALNAWVDVDSQSQDAYSEIARSAAKEIDDQRSRKENVGVLEGLPIAIKDGICTRGGLTTAGSKMLGSFRSPDDATCVQQLRAAGAIAIGKTNMDEFSMGSSTENSFWGAVRNPFDLDRVPGGSSGGSAAAVAAGHVPWALGSDTGGSIRQPAAFCGITGLKPTYGRVSRKGLIAYASSLDQIGPMTRNAADCATLLNVISGHDPGDSTSAKREAEDFGRKLNESLTGLRVGICPSFFGDGVDESVAAAVQQAVKKLEALGATAVEIELPHAKFAVATYYVVAPCEASSNLSRYDGVRYTYRHTDESLEAMYEQSRSQGFGPEVRKRIMLGTFALSSGYYDAYYVNASRARNRIKQDFEMAFESVDLIAGPTTPTTAFRLGENIKDPLAMYLADVFTVSANLAGIPAISIPCGHDSYGLPIGLQLQGRRFDEATLLQAAHQFQLNTDWHLVRPPFVNGDQG